MKRLVLTLGVGEVGQAFLALSLPHLAAYARRIGADCRVITQATQSDPGMIHFEKFQIQPYFRDYDRILYVDADVVVMPHAPDIFKEFPSDRFHSWDEGGLIPDFDLIASHIANLGPLENWSGAVFNMGIFLAARKHAHLFDPVPPEVIHRIPLNASPNLSDQIYLNWNLCRLKIPCATLPAAWNWNPIFGYVHPRAHFVHFLGSGFFEPKRDLLPPSQEPLAKRKRQMTELSLSLPDRVAAAEPSLHLCVVGPDRRCSLSLPTYFLPKGTYEVDFTLNPAAESAPEVRCCLFGKKNEDRVVARWKWAAVESRVVQKFTTEDVEYPHFCFETMESTWRVTSVKIRWLGTHSEFRTRRQFKEKSWIFRRKPAKAIRKPTVFC